MGATWQKVAFAPEVRHELNEAYLAHNGHRMGTGMRFVYRFVEMVDFITSKPEFFPAVEADIRRAVMPRFPYCIFYRFDGKVVLILGVIRRHR